ncbi:MAG: chorismate synthase [Armatimonadetes bacterium CG_4_10_14_3_um_filter_66_18]|nr:chorismate synthase [Armatimonadota bacterium]OIP11581.1 MAG: chorismate synthase [Armatimonadetes bacterium CG2_30_66_41]PIU94687.1 MAG: chorismate synthase [Armatimonadetes bacterium CG06_land_8_20_14_3_00_66_21]PIX38796.1 MAG: chorismate synthase [Armatimonadetes bacterium CG_4_8_14_3_um_filter_66_20]PIY42224.1 MAG: chorismate synthase [Armatimonadetes bacterium CG_4_10_14_3_um_filter_66_18]PIZ44302.1 MAG: chorismate synthase [Armatimonadetes bacterium CG_4_10_14_0_8_um_filter_66_14]
MPGSSFGHLFRITTFGESHGGAVGVVVDGATPGLELCEADIQEQLDRRKPGQSSVTTPRAEPDTVQLLSGLFEGRTTGTPILLLLFNKDARPSAYSSLKNVFRPGHADYTYLKKYGRRDHRGSGRASGRETAGRVAAGAIARKLLARRGVSLTAYTWRAAGVQCQTVQFDQIESNPMRACDPEAAVEMVRRVEAARDRGDSVGGILECRINGVPAGLGEPVFDKLDAELAKAVLSVGATKGIEFGSGFGAVDLAGSEHNDAMAADGFVTNNAGGVLGGISTGQEIVFRVAVKPPSSIRAEQRTVGLDGEETALSIEGRHDPCICPRIVPVIEAMAALVLEDHFKRQEALHA